MAKMILVVDDEPVMVEITKRKLQDQGYEIVTAGDGEEALAQMAKKIPDLILLDVEMPKMNGYTFVMEKSKNPTYKPVPVVVLTAHEEVEPLFKRHGVRGYLLKPMNIQQLLDKVKEVIGPAA